MTFEPSLHLGMLVRAVVVEHQMQGGRGGELAIEAAQEAQELLVPMALETLTDDAPLEDTERSKQGGGSVALVVVGHGTATALLDRQSRLRTVERLDTTLEHVRSWRLDRHSHVRIASFQLSHDHERAGSSRSAEEHEKKRACSSRCHPKRSEGWFIVFDQGPWLSKVRDHG